MTDDQARADAASHKDRYDIVVAADGSEWRTAEQEHDRTRLGPELPPDFPRFTRRLA